MSSVRRAWSVVVFAVMASGLLGGVVSAFDCVAAGSLMF